MIRIDLYHVGSDYRVRVHEHAGGADEACESDCDQETKERAYAQPRESDQETRDRVYAALVRALGPYGHVEFLRMLRDEPRLF